MRPTAEMSRSTWWAFAVGGGLALAAAVVAGLEVVSVALAAGAWQLPTGIFILVAIRRAPGPVVEAIPFLGAGAAGVVLGLVGIVLPSQDSRIALTSIGIWAIVAGAGFLAVARLALAHRVPDGGLYYVAWAATVAGMAISALAVFGLGESALAGAFALVLVGLLTFLGATRLRSLPDEAPPVLSHREQRRRERTGRSG